MCKCGCNKCDVNKAPILNESIASHNSLPLLLKSYINDNKPLTEGLTPRPTKSILRTWAITRSLYSRGLVEVFGNDKILIRETNIGHFGKYKGKDVPLDYPIRLNESNSYYIYTILPNNRKVSKIRFRTPKTDIFEIIKIIKNI